MSEEKTVVRGNPIVPNAPVPSQVRMSMVPTPPTPVPKESGEEKVVDDVGLTSVLPTAKKVVDELLEEEMDAKPKGVVVIKVFENSPYEVEFTGIITGSEIDIAWKAMMKQYRVWKHTLFKQQTSNDGGV